MGQCACVRVRLEEQTGVSSEAERLLYDTHGRPLTRYKAYKLIFMRLFCFVETSTDRLRDSELNYFTTPKSVLDAVLSPRETKSVYPPKQGTYPKVMLCMYICTAEERLVYLTKVSVLVLTGPITFF